MVVVAIAGGTGGVGKTLLDANLLSERHQAIILSRQIPSTQDVQNSKYITVDYNDVERLAFVLRDQRVEVVVSALLLMDEAAAQAQINLIKAAARSETVSKFIPSEYYIDFHKPIPGSCLFTKFEVKAEAELSRHPQLTWTVIRLGIFLDHLTMPYNPKTTHISPYWVFVDLDHEKCVFPGDGNYPLVLTHFTDLAAYVEHLIDLPAERWPRESLIASNKLQVRDLDTLIKKVTGKQFDIVYDSIENVRAGCITPLPSNKRIFEDPAKGAMFREVEHQVMLSMLSHAHDLPGTDLAVLFPDVHVTRIEDFLREGWILKQSKKT